MTCTGARALALGFVTALLSTNGYAATPMAFNPDLSNSSWNTHYQDNAGTFSVQNVSLTFSGGSGFYQTADGSLTGNLTGRFLNQGNDVLWEGSWRASDGSGGFLSFRIQPPYQAIHGQWNNGAVTGTWDGTIVQ